MNRKKLTSVLALILAVLMLLGLIAGIVPTLAYAITQSEIDEIQQQKNSLSNQVQECRDRLEQLKTEQSNVLEQKSALDEQNRLANEQLELVAAEIAIYDDMIAEKAQEVEKAKNREEYQLRLYRTRVRAMEESGGYNILAVILNSSNFNEFLTALDDMGEIMKNDKLIEQRYKEAREETEEIKAEYEAEKAEYEEKQAELRAEQEAIELEIDNAYATLAELEEQIEQAVKEYEAAEAAEQAAAATILDLIRRYNAEQAALNASNNTGNSTGGSTGSSGDGGSTGSTGNSGSSGGNTSSGGLNPGAATGTGSFIWPVPCSTRVTSRFGYRIDPFNGTQTFHTGIDIDGFGNAGNSIVAADSGTVITASFDSGYGNYVIIDHGNSTQTLYAHMSGIAVSYGSWVEQGQVIGYLGDTGRATGVHCHYEVFVDGSRVDPTAYYSGLSYWNC